MTDAPTKAGERGKPILFSAPMVKALIAGTKTQTRRTLKPQPADDGKYHDLKACYRAMRIYPGDRLWVRESVRGEELECGQDGVRYRADDVFIPIANTPRASIDWLTLHTYRGHSGTPVGPWVPGIHMPRWASRLTLIVTGVRVQRLQDISNDDCIAEGVPAHPNPNAPRTGPAIDAFAREHGLISHYGAEYRRIWNAINGAGSWAANPWIAAYSFEVHHQNIDALPLPAARDAASREVGG